MAPEFTTSYVVDALSLLHRYQKPGDGAMAQVDDAHWFAVPGGNAGQSAGEISWQFQRRSRTAFPITDGDKTCRRDHTNRTGRPGGVPKQ